MPNFVKKKLQVFVSSTYTDLIQERQAAVEAILTAGHIPAGMELFTSGDETQLEVINQWIDESDIYLLILGGRYGSIEPKTGKSYTHLEYEYALNQNKPSFACVITESAIDKRVKEKGLVVAETENTNKLKDFRSFIFTKVHKPWDDFKDIKITVSESLARRDDLQGWVRPKTEENIPAHIVEEIARLSKENAELRSQLEKNSEVSFHGLSFNELKEKLEREDLLQFVETHQSLFAVGKQSYMFDGGNASEITERKLEQLCALGLVSTEFTNKSRIFKLSDSGRTFLNKLELWKSQQNSDS